LLPPLLFVLLNLVRNLDLKELGVDIRMFLLDMFTGLLLGSADLVEVSLFYAVEQRTVAGLSSAVRVVEMGVVARLVADVALHVATAGLCARHLVAAILFDKRCTAWLY
jgi:hypothetical protein